MTELEKYNKESIELYLEENEEVCKEVIELFDTFGAMSNDYLISVEDLLSDDDEKPSFDKMDIEESLRLARKFLGTIDKSYVEKFDKSISDGTFELFLPEDNLVERPEYPITTPVPQASIYIPVQNTIEDGAVIVHEFLHYTNDTENLVGVREIFTEMISIYFELRYYQFLSDNGYGNNNYYKEIYSRLDNAFDSANNLCYTASIFDIYQATGKINKTNIKFVNKYRDLFYNENATNLIGFYKSEDFEEGISSFRIDVSYLMGSLLAFFSLKNPEMNDIRMNYINHKVNDLTIKEVLDILETRIEDYPIWINDSVDSLEKALGEVYGYSDSGANRSR